MRSPRVLLVTDAAYPDEVVLRAIDAVAGVAPAGAFAVQLRDRERSARDRAAWAERLRAWTAARRVALVVNGDVALARAVGADGAHFGGGASPAAIAAATGLWRSVAAHTDEDVVAARAAGVDAVLVSPVYVTPGKGPPRGLSALTRAASIAGGKLAVFALGGVTAGNAGACFGAGADGVAVIRGLLAAADPAAVARDLFAASAGGPSPART